MTAFKENDLVIYTDNAGNRFDTFVIFDTHPLTGLTHINHLNLKVKPSSLELHPRSVMGAAIPLADKVSFKLFSELKKKYMQLDQIRKTTTAITLYRNINNSPLLAKVS